MTFKTLIVTPILTGEILARGYKYPRLVLTEKRSYSRCREVCINETRSELQALVAEKYSSNYDVVILMDADVIVTDADLDALVSRVDKFSTVCIRTKDVEWPNHICCACCAMYMKDYLNIDYMDNPKECQCRKVMSPRYIDDLRGTESKG